MEADFSLEDFPIGCEVEATTGDLIGPIRGRVTEHRPPDLTAKLDEWAHYPGVAIMRANGMEYALRLGGARYGVKNGAITLRRTDIFGVSATVAVADEGYKPDGFDPEAFKAYGKTLMGR